MIKRYLHFIGESNDVDITSDSEKSPTNYGDIKDQVKQMIEDSLKTSDSKTYDDFIKSYNRNPEEAQIEGLINDSDVYEFYLKYRNDIDEILSEINFYDENPSEMNCFSLYDYIIQGTKKAVGEIIDMISNEKSENSDVI